ncbi:MAG TPA: helix-turn-helix transcriptional regulator [Bryobacteraceae bacterium]|nr:helix-turn-helix transcriptional regulator [Bryobacteraceae bacterium]
MDKPLDRRVRATLVFLAERSVCSVRDLAREMRLSRGALQRLFKKEMGMPVSAYLADQRLQKAARLLRASSLSIKEIAFSVGYEHHSSFTRAFESRFSQSPKQYREQKDIAEC